MRKSMIVMVRALMYMIAISPLFALATSLLSSSPADKVRVLAPKWDVVCALWSSRSFQARPNHYLLNRNSGETRPFAMPAGERLGLVSVSPWLDSEGNSEAVGQCNSQATGDGAGPFWGLVRLSVPRMLPIDRIQLNILPTSRPCWVPGRPGTIIFAAGDGQRYWFDFTTPAVTEVDPSSETADPSTAPVPRIVAWNSPGPCNGAVFLADPAWPGNPSFPRIVFATVMNAPNLSG
jgi:hypothetical protein